MTYSTGIPRHCFGGLNQGSLVFVSIPWTGFQSHGAIRSRLGRPGVAHQRAHPVPFSVMSGGGEELDSPFFNAAPPAPLADGDVEPESAGGFSSFQSQSTYIPYVIVLEECSHCKFQLQ